MSNSFIQPIYGLEVAVTGLREINRAHHILDNYLHRQYGDIIAHSRMELDEDVYCVVLTTWRTTTSILTDSFNAFKESGSTFSQLFTTSDPYLLYLINTAGIPTNPTFLSSASPSLAASSGELQTLRAELEEVHQQGVMAMNSFHSILHDFHSSLDDLHQQCLLSTQAVSTLSASLTVSNRLNTLNVQLLAAQQDRNMAELMIMFTSGTNDRQSASLSTHICQVRVLQAQVRQRKW